MGVLLPAVFSTPTPAGAPPFREASAIVLWATFPSRLVPRPRPCTLAPSCGPIPSAQIFLPQPTNNSRSAPPGTGTSDPPIPVAKLSFKTSVGKLESARPTRKFRSMFRAVAPLLRPTAVILAFMAPVGQSESMGAPRAPRQPHSTALQAPAA